MKKRKPTALVSVLGIILSISMFVMPARAVDQPRMQAAKSDLENALKFLQKATADKGGHREQAIDLVTRAITAVNNGIEYDRTHITVRPPRKSSKGEINLLGVNSTADQPNMTAAREHLNYALGNLNRASADKGGYREQAQALVREAITQVNAGIEYDRTH